MNKNVFLFNPDTMICSWKNNLELGSELIIGSFECKIGFKDIVTIATTRIINDDLYIPNDSKWKSTKFLKSHLQKCIRRMKPDLSVQTACELIRLNLNDFLRRLPIIILEDVDLLSVLPTTIWLMVAYSKGYRLRNNDISWLLGVVKSLAICPYRTKIDFHNVKKYKREWVQSENVYFNSILLRVSYGGMKGDMNMLKNAAFLSYNNEIKKLKMEKIEMKDKKLNLSDVISIGMDFHVDKSILYKIQNYFRKDNLFVNKETLKSWMWQTRSGINYREKNKKEKCNPLKKYHKDVDNICLEIIRNNYYKK